MVGRVTARVGGADHKIDPRRRFVVEHNAVNELELIPVRRKDNLKTRIGRFECKRSVAVEEVNVHHPMAAPATFS